MKCYHPKHGGYHWVSLNVYDGNTTDRTDMYRIQTSLSLLIYDVSAFVFVALCLATSTLALASSETKYCYGDICNKGTKIQFCSTHFKLCRNCEDIVMDCGMESQPLECTDFCISHKVELDLRRKRDSNCSALSPVANQVVSTIDQYYKQGEVSEIECDEGFEPHFYNTVVCGEYGIFRHSAISCKAKTCSLSMTISNGFVHPHSNASGRYTINTTVTFGCLEGFTLHGVKKATCLGDNQWTAKEAPYCLEDAYIRSRKLVPVLLTLCSSFFVIGVIISLIGWRYNTRWQNSKKGYHCTQNSRESVAESGIDVTELDETEPILGTTNTEDQSGGTNTDQSFLKEPISTSNCQGVVPTAPPDENGQITKSLPLNNTINLTMNVNQDQRNITHQENSLKKRGEENSTGKKCNPPVRKHGAEKMPTEETQETTEALQETQEGTKPIEQSQSDNEKKKHVNSIALDTVPVFLRKSPVKEC